MPQRALRWRSLVPGLIAIAVLIAGALAVLRYGRMGALRGDTISLRVLAEDARGVMRGAPVWLAGKRVGEVEAVRFRSIRADTAPALVLQIKVLAKYAPLIRAGSRARIRSGGRLLGAPVVNIAPGTDASPPISPGGVLPAATQLDPQQARARLAAASYEFTTTLGNVGELTRQLDTTLRRVERIRSGGTADLSSALARLDALAAHARGAGTLGRLGSDATLAERTRRVGARADSLAALLQSARRTASQGVLLERVGSVQSDVATLRALLAESRGSAGRFLHDRALSLQLARIERQVAAIAADAKRGALAGGTLRMP